MGELNEQQQALDFDAANNFIMEYMVSKGFNQLHTMVALLEVLKLDVHQHFVRLRIQEAQKQAAPKEPVQMDLFDEAEVP